jgi:hypothetical protein
MPGILFSFLRPLVIDLSSLRRLVDTMILVIFCLSKRSATCPDIIRLIVLWLFRLTANQRFLRLLILKNLPFLTYVSLLTTYYPFV